MSARKPTPDNILGPSVAVQEVQYLARQPAADVDVIGELLGGSYGLTPATVESAKMILAHARDVDEVKDIRDKAEALRQYIKQQGDSLEAQNYAAEIKLRAERRAGELLTDMEKAKGGSPYQEQISTGNIVLPVEVTPTLDDLGISKMQSSRWQAIATLPEEVFEEQIAATKADAQELTTASMLRTAQEFKRQQRADQMADAPVMPEAKYRVIYADPPWHYNNSGVITDSDAYGRAARHYPTMTIDELCGLGTKVQEMAEDNAVMFMWATSPLLEDAFRVVDAWGFDYKTSFVWDKIRHNFGHYNSVRHEFLLVCTRGSCTPDEHTLYDSVVTVERSDKHSEKPEEFRSMIDSLYTWGKRIELFARAQADGWDGWGNQA